MTRHIKTALVAAALAATASLGGCDRTPGALVRHNVAKFPIASTIEVPAGYSTIYVSGMGADVADKTATPMTLAAYGNTETQVNSALTKIQATLDGLHLSFADVVQMHVYMVADPATGKMDFPGLMKAYTRFFGTDAQPNLPTRAAFQVAALANPGWLVEIEVTAVRKP